MDDIAFGPDGFCRHLRAIAEGKSKPADIDALEAFYRETSTRVVESVARLRQYREAVREQCGRRAAEELSNLIDGPNGKFVIRYEIEALVDMCRDRKNPEAILKQTSSISAKIEAFNDQLTKVHDTIFPPRGAPG